MKPKTPKSRLDANQRHMEKLQTIAVRVHRDGSDGITVDQIREAAERDGARSVNAWIIEAIRDKL